MHLIELRAVKNELIGSIKRLNTFYVNEKIIGEVDRKRSLKTITNLRSHLWCISQKIITATPKPKVAITNAVNILNEIKEPVNTFKAP